MDSSSCRRALDDLSLVSRPVGIQRRRFDMRRDRVDGALNAPGCTAFPAVSISVGVESREFGSLYIRERTVHRRHPGDVQQFHRAGDDSRLDVMYGKRALTRN